MHPLPLGGESPYIYVTDSFFPASLSPITPCQPSPSGLFSSMSSRFLLTAVALLSSYSIHLLLKSSGIVGKLLAGLQKGWGQGEEGLAPLAILTSCVHRHPCL